MSAQGEPDATFGLVMPFVVCRSNGGPYDDEAFVAGVYCGSIDQELQTRSICGPQKYVPTAVVPQLDLLAMHRGYEMSAEPWGDHPEWTLVSFWRPEEEEF